MILSNQESAISLSEEHISLPRSPSSHIINNLVQIGTAISNPISDSLTEQSFENFVGNNNIQEDATVVNFPIILQSNS